MNDAENEHDRYWIALNGSSGSVRVIKPDKPEPPTNGPTIWQDAARREPLLIQREA